eukprot:1429414-Rhodomonas_salina.1
MLCLSSRLSSSNLPTSPCTISLRISLFACPISLCPPSNPRTISLPYLPPLRPSTLPPLSIPSLSHSYNMLFPNNNVLDNVLNNVRDNVCARAGAAHTGGRVRAGSRVDHLQQELEGPLCFSLLLTLPLSPLPPLPPPSPHQPSSLCSVSPQCVPS